MFYASLLGFEVAEGSPPPDEKGRRRPMRKVAAAP
jgi:hypothetical protein